MTTRANPKGSDVDLNFLPSIHSVHSLNFILPCLSVPAMISYWRQFEDYGSILTEKMLFLLKKLVPKVDLRKKPLIIRRSRCSETSSRENKFRS